ncbi:hypothetical protein ACFLZ6_00645 [Nanoarchaeota archaeon]
MKRMETATLENITQVEARALEPRMDVVNPVLVKEQIESIKQNSKSIEHIGRVAPKKGLYTRLTEKLKYASLGALVTDIVGLARGLPAVLETYASSAIIGAKTALEAPGLVAHIYNTGKQKGARRLSTRLLYGTACNALDLAVYTGTKLVGAAVPVVGPLVEMNSYKRFNERKASKAVSWLGRKLWGAAKYVTNAVANTVYDTGKKIYDQIANAKPVQASYNLETAALNPA